MPTCFGPGPSDPHYEKCPPCPLYAFGAPSKPHTQNVIGRPLRETEGVRGAVRETLPVWWTLPSKHLFSAAEALEAIPRGLLAGLNQPPEGTYTKDGTYSRPHRCSAAYGKRRELANN